MVISRDPRILMLLDDSREWLDFEGAFGVEVSMDTDLGVFGEVCESMGVISMEKSVDEERSRGEFWNEEEGGASWFKSSPLDPNTQEMIVYNDWNVARKDEG
jgi:hypothetical protein